VIEKQTLGQYYSMAEFRYYPTDVVKTLLCRAQ